ncbi:hypothetical protein KGA66_19150 [Actinocrinis puniceicyclus]|uniref:Uncharacterized protein n=1 Tax=Actinocrinis puniceicyclus TaxID=977794 RepID=A0A8J7WMN8_9ACTN|nr:hypothetical protein [Actinocrinis puniceicyclus]
MFSALKHVRTPCSFDRGVIRTLLVVAAHLVRTCRQFGEGDRRDSHLVRQFAGIDPCPENHDVGVEQSASSVLSGHTGHLGGGWPPAYREVARSATGCCKLGRGSVVMFETGLTPVGRNVGRRSRITESRIVWSMAFVS